jgi:hypothetical protein
LPLKMKAHTWTHSSQHVSYDLQYKETSSSKPEYSILLHTYKWIIETAKLNKMGIFIFHICIVKTYFYKFSVFSLVPCRTYVILNSVKKQNKGGGGSFKCQNDKRYVGVT